MADNHDEATCEGHAENLERQYEVQQSLVDTLAEVLRYMSDNHCGDAAGQLGGAYVEEAAMTVWEAVRGDVRGVLGLPVGEDAGDGDEDGGEALVGSTQNVTVH